MIAARRTNYARRQQYLRLTRAGEAALAAILLAVLGALAASARLELPAIGLLIAAAVLGINARQWLALAHRSRVGAKSEDAVQRALAPLEVEGWRLRHSLPWRGRGDIDSVAIAPTGIAVAIETKTRRYDRGHLVRIQQQAVWLSRRRRKWARNGVLAVICVVRARGVECVEDDVLVVSLDRLTRVLRIAAAIQSARTR
jgi:hypothetical protein